jgi:DNA-binding MurR/RpiR family transcriptional regulator
MLQDAMGRLVAGRPRVTDGRLTVANLAREAWVGRSTANRATNVLDAFHVSAARVPLRRRPETEAVASRSRDAAEIASLKEIVNQLAQQAILSVCAIRSAYCWNGN